MKLTQRTLHNRAKLADFHYPQANQQLGENMLKFMRQQHGIGLAATQIGERVCVFVMEIGSQQWICFNPEIEKLNVSFGRISITSYQAIGYINVSRL
jgi:peptide deformylase